jgi:hypothetical protein
MRPLLALYASLLAGCVPFALPPASLQAGAGARSQREAGVGSTDTALQLRATITPLSGLEAFQARRTEFGVGGFIDTSPGGVQQGAFLEAGLFPVVMPLEGKAVRVSPRLQGRLLYDPDHRAFGQGAALQLQVDVVSFTDGSFNSTGNGSGAFGVAHGEAGVGIYIEGSVAEPRGERLASVGGGLIIRMPAMAGFVWRLSP